MQAINLIFDRFKRQILGALCVYIVAFPSVQAAQETDKIRNIEDAQDKTETFISSNTPQQKRDPFTALLTRRGPSAIVLTARDPVVYETTEGDETFVFQASGNTAQIRFLCDPNNANDMECLLLNGQTGEEVYLLTATRSPRGDIIYKDVDGEAVLRVTTNGGATLFRPDRQEVSASGAYIPSGGIAVLPIHGTTASLKAPAIRYDLVEDRMRHASDIFVERYGALIFFQAPGPDGSDQAVLADAILTTTKGLDIVASDDLGARVLSEQLETVKFIAGDHPTLSFTNGILSVTYNVDLDIKGRPSSAAVARYMESVL